MIKQVTSIAAGLGVLFASAAFAGAYEPRTVTIDLSTNFADGDMWTARTSPGDGQFIGCGIREFDDNAGGSFSFGFCQAEDAAANLIICFTQNNDLLEAIRASAALSYVTFSWTDDGAGNLTCSRIGFSNQSFYLPEFKTK